MVRTLKRKKKSTRGKSTLALELVARFAWAACVTSSIDIGACFTVAAVTRRLDLLNADSTFILVVSISSKPF
jgi:hypothetical protein